MAVSARLCVTGAGLKSGGSEIAQAFAPLE